MPGHTGNGVSGPVKDAGRYEIDQNGTKVAGGPVPHFTGVLAERARLSPSPSVIKVTFDASQSPVLGPLSPASQTVWTWRSARTAAAKLPPGWFCPVSRSGERVCAVQPMITLRYGVVGEALNGSANPGQQVIRVSVGHIQLAARPRITGLTLQVSFDGGKTWRAARVTGVNGSYAVVFTAPAGVTVTMRTHATDAAGGSVTETIDNAYQIAS